MRQRIKYGVSNKEWIRRHKMERLKVQATTIAVLVVPAMAALCYILGKTG